MFAARSIETADKPASHPIPGLRPGPVRFSIAGPTSPRTSPGFVRQPAAALLR